MKGLLLGILLIAILGIGGVVYRNAVEHPSQPIVCPLDAIVCPDGTPISRVGSSCTFLACPPPNVSLSDIGIAFVLPDGFMSSSRPGDTGDLVMQYSMPVGSSTANITISRFMIETSPDSTSSQQATALSTIQQTAIGGASGAPVSATSFSSTVLGGHRFTVVSIERFEGVIDTAYYLARSTDVLRFDAIDRGADWTNPSLNISTLPAHAALRELLTTLQWQ